MTARGSFIGRGLGVALILASAGALLLPEATEWARPRFYRAWLSLSGPQDPGDAVRVVSVERQSLPEVLEAVARARPAVVALDPALWDVDGNALDISFLSVFENRPVILGWHADPAPAEESATASIPLPRLSTLEGMLPAGGLPRLRLRPASYQGDWPAAVTVGFVERPRAPVFENRALAGGAEGFMPSLAVEALRRHLGVSPERVAYVEGIGLLIGPEVTMPLGREGQVALRLAAPPVLPADRLAESDASLRDRIVVVASARHVLTTVAGPRLAGEIWASQIQDALARRVPGLPASASKLALAVGAGGLLALLAAAAYGMGAAGLVFLGLGLALLYPLASAGFFLAAGWWLPPEKPFFALAAAALGLPLLWPRSRVPNFPMPAAPVRPAPAAAHSAPQPPPPPRPPDSPAPPPLRPRARSGERQGPAKPEPGIERDAQGGLVRLGKYRILRKMGSGSAGDVFEGMDTQMSRRVAIKAMTRGAQLHFDHALERFVVEAKAAGSLNHPNINTIYDFGTVGSVSFMVLEYLDGVTLSQWMRGNPPPAPPAVQEWIRQICSALDYAHEHRVIHRDLKPSNLMVIDAGQTMKLLDFGVAKLEDVMLTQTGMTVGTPSYMSPEQLQGEKVAPASDQYSLAVLLYQLFSHKLPYAGTKIPEICNRILRHELIPLTEANPDLAGPYWTALEPALAMAPSERYPNCMALFEALERVWSASPAGRA